MRFTEEELGLLIGLLVKAIEECEAADSQSQEAEHDLIEAIAVYSDLLDKIEKMAKEVR